jgi:hypothetical protein
MEWHLSRNLPANYKSVQPETMIFCDSKSYYTGYVNFQGYWLDIKSGKLVEDVEGWAYLPPSPITFGSAEVIQEWNVGNGPVTKDFKHFLLYDLEEIVYKQIDSAHFDSKNNTFPEVSHWIVLPELPLHFREFGIVKKVKKHFFDALEEKLPGFVLEPFNEECLSQSIGAMANTTINGVPEIDTLSEDEVYQNTINRWNWTLELWLKNAEKFPDRNYTYGTTKVPQQPVQIKKLRESIETVVRVFSLSSIN